MSMIGVLIRAGVATGGPQRVIITVTYTKPRSRGASNGGWKWNRGAISGGHMSPGRHYGRTYTRVVNRGETRFDPFRHVSPDATLPLKNPQCLLRSFSSAPTTFRESQSLSRIRLTLEKQALCHSFFEWQENSFSFFLKRSISKVRLVLSEKI